MAVTDSMTRSLAEPGAQHDKNEKVTATNAKSQSMTEIRFELNELIAIKCPVSNVE